MTFPHKTRYTRAGFTLLEIVIVLMVFALLVGGAVTTVVLSSSERALTNASSEIELLAKKARTTAILHQKPYAIEFRENSLRLLPFAEASDETERTTALGNEIGGSEVKSETGATPREDVAIDSDISLSVRRWNTEDFITPKKNLTPVWRFDPNGLSEPITVRMTISDSYAQDTYHPLTATIADSELEAK